MPIVADAAVRVGADLKPYNQQMAGAGKQADTLGGKLKAALSPKNLAIGLGIGVGIQQVTAFLGDSISAASDLNEVVSKTGEIIGHDMLPGMEAWAETASDAFGQSKRQALDGAATFAIFGKSAGLAGEDLAGFSTEMVELASDFASFHNASPEEAITAIGAALRGESEPIRRFGILLDDATLRARALKLGIIDNIKTALTPQQRVLAAQAEILEQSADAQGDFARTSDGLANSQRTLSARMEDAQAVLGEKLLPIMLAFTEFLSNVAVPAIEAVADVLGTMGKGLGNIGDSFRDAAADVHFFSMNFGEQGDAVHRLADEMGVDFSDLKRTISKEMTETGKTFEEVVADMEADAAVSAAGVTESMTEGMRATHQVVQRTGEDIKRDWEAVSEFIPQAIRDRWGDTRDAAFQMAVEHAKGILDGQNQVKVAFEVLTQIQEEEQTRAQRISYLQGLLSTRELTSGLNDGRPGTRAAARALRGQIEAELATLGVNAYNWGANIGQSLANGLWAKYGVVRDASGGLSGAISGQLGIRSEPKDADSPLRGITQWGGNIVKTIAEGIHANLGLGSGAAGALAGALVPSVGSAAVGVAGGTALAGGGPTINYNLVVEGKPKVVGTREEVIDAWLQMEQF